ncbi:MAG: hypothetical protein IKR67_08075 [Lachnospiraceae bacterium]|nr:hypothetical protein [Lachnospiraceae bacterium]
MEKFMNTFNAINDELYYTNRLWQAAEMRLCVAPKGFLRTSHHNGSIQYYHRQNTKDKNGVYIPADNLELASALAQKKYDQQLVKAARAQIELICSFLRKYDPEALEKVYSSTSRYRRCLIEKAILPDEEYAAKWLAQDYVKKGFTEGSSEYYTQNGERVRSKSEAAIADALLRAELPYLYEYPIDIEDITLYSDFAVLRKRDRRVIRWEHFGMMDDTYYRNEAMSRLKLYEKVGLVPGNGLIITMETIKQPLNLKTIKTTIDHLLY